MYSKVVFKSVGAGFHEHVLVGFSNINLVGCYYTTLMKGTNLASSALRLARPWPTLVAHELPRAHLPLAALRQACIHLYSTVPNYRIENIWLEETAGILQFKPSHWGKLINLVLKIPKKTLRTEKECQKIISGNLVLVSRNCFFQNSVLISNDTLR